MLNSVNQTSRLSQAVTLKLRTDLHVSRKVYHVLGTVLLVYLYSKMNYAVALSTLSIVSVAFVSVDLLRLRSGLVNKAVLAFFKPVMRMEEADKPCAMSFLLLGALFVVALFPKHIGILSLLMLGFGDPISSIIGVLYGKDKIIGNKSLQGSLAGFVTCCIVSAIYFKVFGLFGDRFFLVVVLSGMIGAIAELVPVGKLDDNLTFPIISSCLLWSLFWLFGGF